MLRTMGYVVFVLYFVSEKYFVAAISQQNEKDLIWVQCCSNILPYCEGQKSA